MKKFLLLVLCILTIFSLTGVYLFLLAFEIREDRIIVKDESKPILKAIAKKLNKIIYDKATEYNPEGDFLPDQFDDDIKKQIKQNLE